MTNLELEVLRWTNNLSLEYVGRTSLEVVAKCQNKIPWTQNLTRDI